MSTSVKMAGLYWKGALYLYHYLLQFKGKVDRKRNQVKLESVQTLLRITRLAHKKSYLVIIFPNSHEKLTKSEIRSSWESVWTLLRITRLVHTKSYLAIIGPNSHEKLTKSDIR